MNGSLDMVSESPIRAKCLLALVMATLVLLCSLRNPNSPYEEREEIDVITHTILHTCTSHKHMYASIEIILNIYILHHKTLSVARTTHITHTHTHTHAHTITCISIDTDKQQNLRVSYSINISCSIRI